MVDTYFTHMVILFCVDDYEGYCLKGVRCKLCASNIHNPIIYLNLNCLATDRKKIHKYINMLKALNIRYCIHFNLNLAILFIQNLENCVIWILSLHSVTSIRNKSSPNVNVKYLKHLQFLTLGVQEFKKKKKTYALLESGIIIMCYEQE